MTPQPELFLVKAFTDKSDGGNAAGVVIHADAMAHARKQEIAAQVGLSETAFVSASEVGDVKVEFFTPNRQIPHCGHATVATFGLLLELTYVNEPGAVKESIVGPRQISLKEGKVYQAQLSPKYKTLAEAGVSPGDVAASVGLREEELVAEPILVSTGVWFLLLHLHDEAALQNLKPNQALIEAISENLNLVGYYAFTTASNAADASARMFAPSYGIPEESATGMAAGPLACYLYDYLQYGVSHYNIHQGYLMKPPSPSQIEVELQLNEQGEIIGLQVGGSVVVVRQLELAD
ncbi:PhzF family phenazine biosynthesis protein [Pontibacter akesuensis]|uniref:Phenazine biosynthesis protein PhzF family n=1 Tax=Pontibacter akesuensis TaxID=388950 RepID=A0A1I7FNF5_9BACT|nr:PhzF family phenazine biosynthesis protein [Pontibacter akesuensis]GHA61337.1 phenazine biosynthesis protein PhzF [Pontibacter akesuensis]SFU37701.1 phenazine biosynthesis protein PhzF family [Pontibacter akesuensis]